MKSPQGPETGKDRVFRGGSGFSSAENCRAAYRYRLTPVFRSRRFGFRVALSLPRRKRP